MLARDLGRTVAELLHGRRLPLSALEYAGWVAFYQIEAEDRQGKVKSE